MTDDVEHDLYLECQAYEKQVEELESKLKEANERIEILEKLCAMACERPCGDCAGCDTAKGFHAGEGNES